MSDPTTASVASPSAVIASPEFDAAEEKFFGKEDTHATTAISRMLVIFFFYSLVIMGAVVYTVLHSHWMDAQPNAAHDKHEATAPF